jgi:peptidoglycan/xylan/chitin deacetylase (PgdA/CDA1 family)
MYHHLETEPGGYPYAVNVRAFAEQMAALRRWGYESVSFRQLFRTLRGEADLPRKPVILTFDDGYTSVADLAAPVLQKEGMTATVFVVTDAIGKCNDWDADGGSNLPIMDQTVLRELVAKGWELGAHSCRHPDLSKLDDNQRRVETTRSKMALEEMFGQAIQVFAYPFGICPPEMPSILAAAGYAGGVSIFSPSRSVTSDPFRMRRIYVHQGDTLSRLYVKLTPWYLRFRAYKDQRTFRSGNAKHVGNGHPLAVTGSNEGAIER